MVKPASVIKIDDRAREVAPAERPLFEPIEAPLPALHAFVRREPVIDEVQRAAGLEHAAQLPEGAGHVGDRAQGPAREGRVEAVVGEGQ